MPSSLTDTAKAKTYVAPKLKVYGDARKLTASGTSGTQESVAGGNCSQNGSRRPC